MPVCFYVHSTDDKIFRTFNFTKREKKRNVTTTFHCYLWFDDYATALSYLWPKHFQLSVVDNSAYSLRLFTDTCLLYMARIIASFVQKTFLSRKLVQLNLVSKMSSVKISWKRVVDADETSRPISRSSHGLSFISDNLYLFGGEHEAR